MRILVAALMMVAVMTFALSQPARAQKTENECLDIMSKYLNSLGNLMKEPKPNGACAVSKFLKGRQEDILKMYSAEPAECRSSALGKNLDNTLRTRVRQETSLVNKHCRRR